MIDDNSNGFGVECKFDESTGILHVIVDGPLTEDKPSAGDLMELIAHHRAGRTLNGIVIFNKRDLEMKTYPEMLKLP